MSKITPTPALAPSEFVSRHRSGAVARMLRMPVATLRVWERRYQLTQAALSPSGQRLYSASDIQRLALLKRLTDLGHAIGSLAALDMAQLHEVAATHARALNAAHQGEEGAAPAGAWQLAVIGSGSVSALCKQLQSPELRRRLSRPLQLLGPFEDAAQAEAGLRGASVDALLVQAPHLQADWLAGLPSVAPSLAKLPCAMLYRFAPAAACAAVVDAGALLLREPQCDSVLGLWLQGLLAAGPVTPPTPPLPPAASPSNRGIAPRRWDDAALADFAGLSSTVACECPRHLAELLMQLSHFEAYSAECQNRSPADAQLHRYLREVAASSRSSFEVALEHIALLEGLVLPASSLASGSPAELVP
jgi:DNA-binding transcriptional MerR regulator